MADVRTDAGTVRTSRRARLTFALVAALLGAGVGAAVMYYSYSTRTGDEPPIWVKNGGSIVIEVGGQGWKWKQPNPNAPWTIPGTGRASDRYEVFIAPSEAASCTSGFHHVGQKVGFTYSDDKIVEFAASGRHTAVNPPSGKQLTASSGDRVLTYDDGGDGYIKEISVDSNRVCKFDGKDTNLTLVLLDK